MNCEELHDHYELYAMGVADEPERSEIREHLNRGCEACMAELKRARVMTTLLGSSLDAAAPSPKLRGRILASVGVEQRRFGWAPFLAGALALSLFAAFYFSGREREFATLATRLREQLGQQRIELARLSEAFSILDGPDTTVVSFGTGQPAPPKGKVFVNPARGVLLIASNLPKAPAGKVYEMWLVPKGGKPARAGEFQSASNGTVMHVYRGAVQANETSAVAVTLENEGGADTPTMPLVFAAPLQ